MNFLSNWFTCPLCPVHREHIAFLQNELRMSQDRERTAVNVALAAQEKPLIHAERKILTTEEQKQLQADAEAAIEHSQALFQDESMKTGQGPEKLVEV